MAIGRVFAFALALVGQAALWASPLFACACGPNCAERRTTANPPKGVCCPVEGDGAAEPSSTQTDACCCCSSRGSTNRTSSRAGATDSCVACGSDERSGAPCGQGLGGAEDGSCGCFHGPDFEIASQSAQPRTAVSADLPAAFLASASTDLIAPKATISDHFCGLLPPSGTRIQAMLCVWRK